MFSGIAIGIVAALVWAITNIVDKYLVDKYAADGSVGGVLLLSCFFPLTLLTVAAVVLQGAVFNLARPEIATLMLAGVLMVVWIFFYLKALSVDDSSTVMTLLVLAPFFSLIFAQQILHEMPTAPQLLAGGFLIAGALTVVYEPKKHYFKWGLLGFAVAASTTAGLMSSLFKFVEIDVGLWESLFWRSSGMVATGALLFLLHNQFRQDFKTFIKAHFRQAVGLNITNESLTLLGDTLFAFAMLFAPLALLQTTEAYQPIFIFIMIFVLNRFGFMAVTENFDRRILIQKGAGFALALIGTILLAFET